MHYGIDVAKGTAIATFINGKYPQHYEKGGFHSAIYIGQDAAGMLILDQWRGDRQWHGVNETGMMAIRYVRWMPPPETARSNDASAFSTIRW